MPIIVVLKVRVFIRNQKLMHVTGANIVLYSFWSSFQNDLFLKIILPMAPKNGNNSKMVELRAKKPLQFKSPLLWGSSKFDRF